MACNFSQLRRRQSSGSLNKAKTDDELKDQFYRSVSWSWERKYFGLNLVLLEITEQIPQYWEVWRGQRQAPENKTSEKLIGKENLFFFQDLFWIFFVSVEADQWGELPDNTRHWDRAEKATQGRLLAFGKGTSDTGSGHLETSSCYQADSVASGGAIQEDIKEEDEDEDDEDDKNDDVFGPEKQALTNGPGEEGETWDSKITFMLATIGYAVGLGNVWRLGRKQEEWICKYLLQVSLPRPEEWRR